MTSSSIAVILKDVEVGMHEEKLDRGTPKKANTEYIWSIQYMQKAQDNTKIKGRQNEAGSAKSEKFLVVYFHAKNLKIQTKIFLIKAQLSTVRWLSVLQ